MKIKSVEITCPNCGSSGSVSLRGDGDKSGIECVECRTVFDVTTETIVISPLEQIRAVHRVILTPRKDAIVEEDDDCR